MNERSVECVGTVFIEPQCFAVEFRFETTVLADDNCGREETFRASPDIGSDEQPNACFENCDVVVEADPARR